MTALPSLLRSAAFAVTLSLSLNAYAAPSAVVVNERSIVVTEAVSFAGGTAVVHARSQSLLDEIARALERNPRFTRINVEGHTDSVGDPRRNLLLSQQRANAVKQALIQRGVAAVRIKAIGLGDTRPVASNADAAGRERNRRVAFVIAELDGKQVLASRPPLAKVTHAHNRVDARAPDAPDWAPARAGNGLVRLHRVQSQKRSSAEITFRDASEMQLREKTLVIIFGAAAARARRETGRARLESGALRSRLSELAGGVVVEMPEAETELTRGSALISVDATRTSRVSNHEGKAASLWSRRDGARTGKPVAVAAGFGSKVEEGGAPSAPKPLPPAPVWSDGERVALGLDVYGGTLRGSWQAVAKAARYRLELARTPEGGEVAFAEEASAPTTSFEAHRVPAGVWYARVASIDADGFESKPSPPARFEVLMIASRDDRGPDLVPDGESSPHLKARAGTLLRMPPEMRCSLAGSPPQAEFVTPAGSTVELHCPGAPPLSLQVEDLGVSVASSEGFLGGPARLVLELPSDAPSPLEAVLTPSGRVLSAKRTPTGLELLVQGEPAPSPTLELRHRGVVVARVPVPLRADEQPPTLAVQTKSAASGLTVEADVDDDISGVGVVRLYTRPLAGGAWTAQDMTRKADGQWEAALPAAHTYFVEATDNAGNGPVRASSELRERTATGGLAPWGLVLSVAGGGALVGAFAFGLDAASALDRSRVVAGALEGDVPDATAADLQRTQDQLEAAALGDVIGAAALAVGALGAGVTAGILFALDDAE